MVRMLKGYCFSCHALTNFRCCIMSGDSVDREPGWPKWEAHGLYVKSLIEPGSNLLCPTLAYFLHFEKALGLYVKSLVDPGSDLLCPTFFILKKVLGLYEKKTKNSLMDPGSDLPWPTLAHLLYPEKLWFAGMCLTVSLSSACCKTVKWVIFISSLIDGKCRITEVVVTPSPPGILVQPVPLQQWLNCSINSSNMIILDCVIKWGNTVTLNV